MLIRGLEEKASSRQGHAYLQFQLLGGWPTSAIKFETILGYIARYDVSK